MQLSNKFSLSIKPAPHLPFKYNEAAQTNSLRWTLLYKEEDGTFEDQTGIFKCKDYFNDFVAKYYGFEVAPYGLDTKKIRLNEGGCYILLTGIKHLNEFTHNLDLISQEAHLKQGFPDLDYDVVKSDVLLFIPREYMKSTYTISFLTALVRLAHADKCFNSLAEIVSYQQVDRPFKQYTERALANGFKPPIDGKWFYPGKMYERIITKENVYIKYATVIHNNGAHSWLNMLDAEALSDESEKDEEEEEGV